MAVACGQKFQNHRGEKVSQKRQNFSAGVHHANFLEKLNFDLAGYLRQMLATRG